MTQTHNSIHPYGMFLFQGFANALADVMYILVGDAGTSRQANAYVEHMFAHAIDISGCVMIDGLLVHGFPQGAALYLTCIQEHAQGLYIVIRLAVGAYPSSGVGYA